MQATAGQREPCGFLFLWAPAVPVKCRGKRGRQGEFPWGCGMPGDGEERSGPGGRRRFSMAGQGPPWKNQSRGLRPRLCGRCAPPPPPAGRWAFHQRQKDKKPGPTRYGAGGTTDGRKGGGRVPLPPGGLNHLAAGRSRRANPAAGARLSPSAQDRRARSTRVFVRPGRRLRRSRPSP